MCNIYAGAANAQARWACMFCISMDENVLLEFMEAPPLGLP